MKKNATLAIALAGLWSMSISAQDFQVLTNPADVYANSIEDVAGAKEEFNTVLSNSEATEAELTAAMQEYVQKASPKAGYAFDMNFLLQYTAVTEDNKGKYTQAALAGAWSCDVPGITFGEASSLMVTSTTAAGVYMRVYSANALKSEESLGKFAAYQNVTLSKGAYQLNAEGFVAGLANSAVLAAGDLVESDKFKGGGVLAPYSVSFKMDGTEEIKLGFKRNETAGGCTTIAFNNMELYKVSTMVQITDNATGGLAAATDADVEFAREFTADKYYPICLPFIVENWREVFDDLQLWNNYSDGTLAFASITGANTQARKPYLAKFKENIDASNYLVFNGVDIQAGNPGSWTRSQAEGEEAFPVKMVGNWAAGTVPAGCYYLEGDEWHLSNGSAAIPAFSAYIDATALAEKPEVMSMDNGLGNTTVIDVVDYNAETLVNVYNLQGVVVRKGVRYENALSELPAGIYIVNGKKIVK
ncbi:MAG: T9SS type A sorting domain-containing protein [Bacteroidales bacterium]|nr:T9SS type A sorting domain-containing protein [Bacteroidales bacterium]